MMRKIFLLAILFGMGSLSVQSEPSEKAIAEASEAFLEKVVREFGHSPAAAPYFAGTSTDNVSLQRYAPLVNSPDGWAYDWHYQHDVTYVAAETQSGQSVVYGSHAPIIIDIWAVYKFGTGKPAFPWNKRYLVLDKPTLEVGFGLGTGNDAIQKQFVQKLDDIMKTNLVILRKALEGP